MFRRLAPRLCAKVTPPAATAAAAAAPAATAAVGKKKPRTFEAADEEHAATSAPDPSAFPTPTPPQAANTQTINNTSPLPNDDDPQLSAAAKRKIEIVNQIGDEAFEENTRVIKNMALRGMRSGLIIVVGVVAFVISLKRKKRRDAAFDEEERLKKLADPTARYLEEMSGLGFDTEQGEADAAEAKKKAAAMQQQAVASAAANKK